MAQACRRLTPNPFKPGLDVVAVLQRDGKLATPAQAALKRRQVAYKARHMRAARATDSRLSALCQAVGQITGRVPKTNVLWFEAFRFRLERRLSCLWLLLEPTIWVDPFDNDDDTTVIDAVRDFRRERLAERYNRSWNALLDAWAHLFTGPSGDTDIRTYGIQDGVDAVFKIGKVTAFSAR